MPRDAQSYLYDVNLACGRILGLTQDLTLETFVSNDPMRWAIERQLSILGEAIYQLQHYFPMLAEKIPECREIVRFRHVLIHGYATVDNTVVWGVVQHHVPVLERTVNALLEADNGA